VADQFIKTNGKQIAFQFRQLGSFDGVERRVDDATRKGLQLALQVLRDSIRQTFEERHFAEHPYHSVNERPDDHPSQGQAKFATNISYQTRVQGHNVVGQVYIGGEKSWLTDILRFGARPHPITPVSKSVLSFYWWQGPDGPGQYVRPGVEHPGIWAPTDFVVLGQQRVMSSVQDILVNGVKNEFQ
jgi:hypothetical protein